MPPNDDQHKVVHLYAAGCTRREARQRLRKEGYEWQHISQMLQPWPPAVAGPTTGAAPSAAPLRQPMSEPVSSQTPKPTRLQPACDASPHFAARAPEEQPRFNWRALEAFLSERQLTSAARSLYKAGATKDEVSKRLKTEGYQQAKISQLLHEWPLQAASSGSIEEMCLAESRQEMTAASGWPAIVSESSTATLNADKDARSSAKRPSSGAAYSGLHPTPEGK